MERPRGPLLLYDGDCCFCRLWVARWKSLSSGTIPAESYRNAGQRFPEIPTNDLEAAVHFIARDGTIRKGAAAVFLSLDEGGAARLPWLAYQKLPGFAKMTEAVYRFIAARRPLFSRLTKLLWGDSVEPTTYLAATAAFIRLLGVVYLCAFASLGIQMQGLVGENAILPPPVWASGDALRMACWGGATLSAPVILGLFQGPLLLGLWLIYFFLLRSSGIFLGFQWDILLLETGFLAAFAASWKIRSRWKNDTEAPTAALWALRWLLFRLMFMSGAVKLLSGDSAWKSLTALFYHYESQPLPTAFAWYAHQLPTAVQKICVAATYAIELLLPFAIFGPRRLRQFAAFGFLLLMGLIAITGNYNFFNLLTAALCLLLIDDHALGLKPPPSVQPHPLRRRAAAALAIFVLISGASQMLLRFFPSRQGNPWLNAVADAGHRHALVNSYGLFAVMTTARNEIVLEGSADGRAWREYDFKWKPGDPARPPGWAQPHQPRLDWQMWFAALSPWRNNPWYFHFQKRILEGRPEVLSLLASNPFPEKPPRFLRSLVYSYRFTGPGEKAWWTRELLGLYSPATTLSEKGELILIQ